MWQTFVNQEDKEPEKPPASAVKVPHCFCDMHTSVGLHVTTIDSINSFQDEISELEDRIDELNEDYAEHSTELFKLEESIRALEEEAASQGDLAFKASGKDKKKHEAAQRETMVKLLETRSQHQALSLKRDQTSETLENTQEQLTKRKATEA